MSKDDFLEKCRLIGVDSIEPIDNDYDDGFKVVFKDKSAAYIIHRNEYGDNWMEYETDEHFIERWKNTKILTPYEAHEFNRKAVETIKEKYSEPNFSLLMEHIFPDKNQNDNG